MLTFDNMKTVTTGRHAREQPVWHPAFLQLAGSPEVDASAPETDAERQAGGDE